MQPASTNPRTFAPAGLEHIKLAGSSDLNYLYHLQSKWSHNVGFLNKVILETYIESGAAWLIDENTQAAGYLLIYPHQDGLLKVSQVAIEPELLRTTLGTQLMETLIKAARAHESTAIRLISRQDIKANLFWPTLGFTHSGTLRSKKPRAPLKFEWTLLLNQTPTDAVFVPRQQPPPACRRRRDRNTILPRRCIKISTP